jgi:hypothetical protein
MKKTVSAFALITAVALGTIGLTIGSASAHDATLKYDCFTVTATFTNFATNPPGTGANTATVTVNGAATNFSWTTKDFTGTVPFTSHKGDPPVVVKVTFHGLDGNTGSASQTFPADACAAPAVITVPPTTPTTTIPTNVSPAVVTRTAPAAAPAAAAEAVVASPAFTG